MRIHANFLSIQIDLFAYNMVLAYAFASLDLLLVDAYLTHSGQGKNLGFLRRNQRNVEPGATIQYPGTSGERRPRNNNCYHTS